MKKKFLFGQTWAFEGYLPQEKKIDLQGIAVKRSLFRKRSRYQLIEIAETAGFGRILFLDGLIQLTTRWEAIYHEMLVHPALLSHSAPERVLIIGGGDGGALREALKHPVKEVILAEIDKDVLEASQKYLRSVCRFSFEDPRVRVFVEDGQDFIKQYLGYFDCVILDVNDPDGFVSPRLFQKLFFQRAKIALRTGGILAAQTGCVGEPFGEQAREALEEVFRFCEVHRAFVPNFTTGEHTFSFGSVHVNLSRIPEPILAQRYRKRSLKTKYYSPRMHHASRVFPQLFQL